VNDEIEMFDQTKNVQESISLTNKLISIPNALGSANSPIFTFVLKIVPIYTVKISGSVCKFLRLYRESEGDFIYTEKTWLVPW